MPIDHGFRGLTFPYVASPQVLHALGIDASTVLPSTELLTSIQGDVTLLDIATRPDPDAPRAAVQRVGLPTYTSAPNSLITPSAMRAHGWVSARASWLVESARPLTTAQITAARHAAAATGLAIETRSTEDGLTTLRTVATITGAVVALAILAMTIGLLRGETAGDLRTLTAVGAGARSRRAVAATTAAALAARGVVLSVAGAYTAMAAAYHAELGRLVPVPVVDLLLLAIGLPAAAAAGGWLLAGREPRTFARQALE
jgi:putative ABC transport system permease protein